MHAHMHMAIATYMACKQSSVWNYCFTLYPSMQLKTKNIVELSSSCTLPEMKRLLAILDMFLVTDAIHKDTYMKTALSGRGRNAASCYCPWFKFEVLNNNCSSTNLGRDILGLSQRCTFCTDQENITSKVDSCLCREDDSQSFC